MKLNKQLKYWGLANLVLLMIAGLVGCDLVSRPPTPSPTPVEPIKLGVLVPLSGPAAGGGRKMADAFAMAAEEINHSGRVLGREIELVVFDTETDPDKAVAGAERLIEEDGVWALIGVYRSGVALAIAEVAADHKAIFLDTVAADPAVTRLVADDYERYKYVFRTGASSPQFVLNVVPFLTEIVKAKTYYFVGEDTVWAHSVAKGNKAILEEQHGIKEAGTAFAAAGATEFATILSDIKAKDPDVVICSMVGAGGEPFASQFYDARVPAALIATAGLLTFQDTIRGLGERGNYISFMAWAWKVPMTEKTLPFYEHSEEKYGCFPSGYEDVRCYDGLYVLADAISRAGSLDADLVIAALEETDQIGVSGRLVFDASHQVRWGEEYLTGVIGQWMDGEAKILWPTSIATGKLSRPSWAK